MSSASAALLYVLVVGSNTPTAKDVPALRFADDDALAYARLYRELGADVTLLAAPDRETAELDRNVEVDGPPERARFYQALDRIARRIADARRAGRHTEAVLVYAGHGDVEHGEGFVQLADARLRRSELYQEVLPRLRADRVHVIVDACKSYFLAFSRGAAGTRTAHAGPFIDTRGPELFPDVGFLLSTSSGADSHEWEEYSGGIFSHEVRSALRGAADADGDGVISYAELAAFVRRANAAVPNARFRPQFTVVPPHADPNGVRAALLSRPAPPGDHARRVVLDRSVGHALVEDERGRRLADVNPAAPGVVLHLPSVPVYLRPAGEGREYLLPAEGDVQLSTIEPRPAQLARRGALQESFRTLFAEPFGAADLQDELARPAATLEAPGPDRRLEVLRQVKWGALGAAAAAAVAGIGCSLGAYARLQHPGGASRQELVDANIAIDRLNGAAVGLYALAGASAVTSLVLALVPRLERDRARNHSSTVTSLAPGPGAVGAGLSITLP
jgi:hypothetical protein